MVATSAPSPTVAGIAGSQSEVEPSPTAEPADSEPSPTPAPVDAEQSPTPVAVVAELSPTPAPVDADPSPTPGFERRLAYGALACRGRSRAPRHSEHFLEWTPDDARLIFNWGTKIWAIDAAGADLRQVVEVNPVVRSELYESPAPMEYGHHASVSPDGLRIAYSTCEFRTDSLASEFVYYEGDHNLYHYEIATVGMDGESPGRLTENEHYDHYPVWSPDGTRIAFIANSRERLSQTDRWRLFTVSPDGRTSSRSRTNGPPCIPRPGLRTAVARVRCGGTFSTIRTRRLHRPARWVGADQGEQGAQGGGQARVPAFVVPGQRGVGVRQRRWFPRRLDDSDLHGQPLWRLPARGVEQGICRGQSFSSWDFQGIVVAGWGRDSGHRQWRDMGRASGRQRLAQIGPGAVRVHAGGRGGVVERWVKDRGAWNPSITEGRRPQSHLYGPRLDARARSGGSRGDTKSRNRPPGSSRSRRTLRMECAGARGGCRPDGVLGGSGRA